MSSKMKTVIDILRELGQLTLEEQVQEAAAGGDNGQQFSDIGQQVTRQRPTLGDATNTAGKENSPL